MKHDYASFERSLSQKPPADAPRDHAVIGAANLRRMAARSAYGEDVEDRVRRFMPMVRRLAWHVHGSGRPGMELSDLMQAGLVALTECAQKHDAPTEDGFAAYSKLRVRGAMLDLVRREAPISRGAAQRRREIEAKEIALRAELGRLPDERELAEAMGVATAELASLRLSSEPMRFEPIDEAYSDSNAAFADDAPDSFVQLTDAETRGALVAAIADLPERLQLVTKLYFVEELNLTEIAEVLSVSVPRVHQLKAQALARLRQALDGIADII